MTNKNEDMKPGTKFNDDKNRSDKTVRGDEPSRGASRSASGQSGNVGGQSGNRQENDRSVGRSDIGSSNIDRSKSDRSADLESDE